MSSALPHTIHAVLAEHARTRPDAALLIAPETQAQLSYGRLATEAGRFGAWAADIGLSKGDRIAMFLPNGMQAGIIFLAAMANGFTITPLNLLATTPQLVHCLRHSGARILFTCTELMDTVTKALSVAKGDGNAPKVVMVDPDADEFHSGGHPTRDAADPGPGPDDIALLMYTSGTTGMPKGVPLSHANILHAARSVGQWHGLTSADRVLSALPLYHINGQIIATVTPFVTGGSIVAPRRFSASRWWQLVDEYQCTWLNMVPTIIAYLLNAEVDPAGEQHPSVRFGRSASAPLPVEHHQAFEQRFGVPIIEAMGMTETASIVFCNPQDSARRRYGSPGIPCGVEARIAGPDGDDAQPGDIGEVRLRGTNVMQGYFDNPEETAKAFDEQGWLRTGDLGYRDQDGYFVITGRIKELIIKGGENIAPREIDEVLLSHDAVLEAAAVGLPDADYGQEIYAAVTLKPGIRAAPADLIQHCHTHLGRYKSPREILIVEDLPKGASGKIQRLKLGDLWRSTSVA
ncbi:AMP-binding protein [Pusillimonas sp. TS35]|uniref:AMP-binding protein n=1 Tax=Paracandidimonas lactea TaxID=2895524 RepID=UPI00136E7FF1|nr:AMP-binding protein [Paracandidimonas lactea]MYN13516.1 AMP-binding protein [Pusillimonas sp. TS35]